MILILITIVDVCLNWIKENQEIIDDISRSMYRYFKIDVYISKFINESDISYIDIVIKFNEELYIKLYNNKKQ